MVFEHLQGWWLHHFPRHHFPGYSYVHCELKAIQILLLAESDLNTWLFHLFLMPDGIRCCFWARRPLKSSAVEIAAIPSPAYPWCATFSASAVSSPLCHSWCGSLYLSSLPPHTPPWAMARCFCKTSSYLLPSLHLPGSLPLITNIQRIGCPCMSWSIQFVNIKKSNNCSCLKWGKIWIKQSLTL